MAHTFEVPRIPNITTEQQNPETIVPNIEAILNSEARLMFAQAMLPELPIKFRASDTENTTGTVNGVFLASTDKGEPNELAIFGKNKFTFNLFYGVAMHLCAKARVEGAEKAPAKTHNKIAGIMRRLSGDDYPDQTPEEKRVDAQEFDELYDHIVASVGSREAASPVFQDLLTVSARFNDFYMRIQESTSSSEGL